MKTLKKLLKTTAIATLTLFLAFFAYANLVPPGPGERIYMEQPTGLTLVKLPEQFTDADAQALSPQIDRQKGVSSFTFSTQQHLLALTYDANTTTEHDVIDNIRSLGLDVSKNIIASHTPQCPVHKYLDGFYRIKYALCIRK